MNRITHLAAIAVLALAVQPAIAQQPDTSKSAAQAAPTPAEVDQQFAKMQEQMRAMQAQMDQLGKTHDPTERQRLLQSHWTAMQQMMTTMHGAWGGTMGCCAAGAQGMGGHMMGGPMMGGPMMGGHMMWNDYQSLTPEQLRQRQYMMDRWMPMQQMMMDQMMQHQQWMMQPPPVAPSQK